MKAVRAYTCDDCTVGDTFMVVTDNGKHVPLPDLEDIYIGKDLSWCFPADDEWLASCTNIQPVELPDKEEV